MPGCSRTGSTRTPLAAGTEGSPTIRSTGARDGQVTSVSRVHGSGSALPDAAAVGLLENALVPALSKAFPNSVSVTMSLRYSLKG